ncbi:hypothetical protein AURDEDRAFT_176479 [Auricularia subglabra TFB-10046 SS5]|uniref:Uncharacterized protein n=1 Tax=Auricularia subglabra (strain TFB-10046 / SS5) TaxID=717982 RepID=J0WPX6_AURST|nr:hypothetical protein AURDEDRAFT_176479 [Auricularia subglabra TFB-10046 SS5]
MCAGHRPVVIALLPQAFAHGDAATPGAPSAEIAPASHRAFTFNIILGPIATRDRHASSI